MSSEFFILDYKWKRNNRAERKRKNQGILDENEKKWKRMKKTTAVNINNTRGKVKRMKVSDFPTVVPRR